MGRWGDSNRFVSSDRLCLLGLLVAAVLLYTSNLGELPLRDWDEGIVAGVARNIWRSSPESQTWLYPTINYDAPYWNKPPLIHGLVALTYSLFGISEWSTRIVPAVLSACCVPLLYLIGREVFATRLPALFSALVYLTLLPVARHGRVAMLDGAVTCWFCLAVWCLLRGRKYPRWLLGTGLGIGLICLTKGMMMGVLLGGIIIIFVGWDSPRLLLSSYLWSGVVLGLLPAIAWYGLQYLHYGRQFLGTSFGQQTFQRIWKPISSIYAPPWYYLLEIAKYSLPWLIFLPHGVKLALRQRHHSWGKLALVWSGVYLLAVSLMVTKLPWYIIPIYPGLSLLVGAGLATAWSKQQFGYYQKICLSLVALVCWMGGAYYAVVERQLDLGSILLLVAVSLSLAAVLLWRQSRYFIPVIVAGFYLSLWLLFNSNYWLWELNEAFPVKPVAEIIKQQTPPRQIIYTSYPHLRPALEFYSDRVIVPRSNAELQQHWQQENSVYFLITPELISSLNLEQYQLLGVNLPWQLITRDRR
ncbi:glycosyltransferase family 39 protein [Pleurocapsales cyanobacterium LEGE 10410]|nr:glycosyltransferase family 39 protein [Pleurocapsales cyanobacterium LEGE 10410]